MRSPAQLASDKAEAAPSKQQARSEGTRQEVARRATWLKLRRGLLAAQRSRGQGRPSHQ